MAALRAGIDEVRFGFVIFNGRDKTYYSARRERVMAASRSWFARVTSEAPFAPQFVSLAPPQGSTLMCQGFFFNRSRRTPADPFRTFDTLPNVTLYRTPLFSRVRRIIKFCISRARRSLPKSLALPAPSRDFSARGNCNYVCPRSRGAESS